MLVVIMLTLHLRSKKYRYDGSEEMAEDDCPCDRLNTKKGE